jgi:hypothetical protein
MFVSFNITQMSKISKFLLVLKAFEFASIIDFLKLKKLYLLNSMLNFIFLQSTSDIRHPVGAGQSVPYIGGKFKRFSYNWG